MTLFVSSSAMEQALVCAKFYWDTGLFFLRRTEGTKINFQITEIDSLFTLTTPSHIDLKRRQGAFLVNIAFSGPFSVFCTHSKR